MLALSHGDRCHCQVGSCRLPGSGMTPSKVILQGQLADQAIADWSWGKPFRLLWTGKPQLKRLDLQGLAKHLRWDSLSGLSFINSKLAQ